MSGDIPYVNIPAQFEEEKAELMPIIERVLAGGHYIGGPEIEAFEAAMAELCGVKYAVALNSGTDALIFAMKGFGVGPGDEVITPPNSFLASTGAVVNIGATPVFVDVQPDQNIDPEKIEAAITPRTKVIMPVHLTGRIADMDPILDIAKRHGLKVLEDAAQSIGSRYKGRVSGSLGDAAIFSTHPLKNLNAIGDGGVLTTDDADLAEKAKRLRNHGMVDRNTAVEFGYVSRMDTLQAAILHFRLQRLDGVTERRRRNADLYRAHLNPDLVFFPPCRNEEFNTFHTFVIQVDHRDELQAHLAGKGIGTAIHYPIPIHLQPAAADLGFGPGSFPVTERQAERILTLPVNQFTSEDDIIRVAEEVNSFLQSKVGG